MRSLQGLGNCSMTMEWQSGWSTEELLEGQASVSVPAFIFEQCLLPRSTTNSKKSWDKNPGKQRGWRDLCILTLFVLSFLAYTLPFFSYPISETGCWAVEPFGLTQYSLSDALLFLLHFKGTDFLLFPIIVNKQQTPPKPFSTESTLALAFKD